MLISNFQRAAFVKLRRTHKHTHTQRDANRTEVENNNKRKTRGEVGKNKKMNMMKATFRKGFKVAGHVENTTRAACVFLFLLPAMLLVFNLAKVLPQLQVPYPAGIHPVGCAVAGSKST